MRCNKKQPAFAIYPAITFRLSLIISLFLISGVTQKAECLSEKDAPMSEIYQFKAKALDGSDIDFKRYKGDVLLIVNTS